jgi:hypothetical protein
VGLPLLLLRDAFFVVNALNRLNTTRTMERYIDYIINIATATEGEMLQPMYRLNGVAECTEKIVGTLPAIAGLGPVRIGNQAYEQIQHDVYGSAGARGDATSSSTGGCSGRRTRRSSTSSSLSARSARRFWDQARRGALGAPRLQARAHVLVGDVLGRVRPAREDRRPPQADRRGEALAGRMRT